MNLKICLVLAMLLFLNIAVSAQEFDLNRPEMIQSLTANVSMKGGGIISGDLGSKSAEIKVLSFKESKFQKISNLKQVLEINGKNYFGKTETDDSENNFAVFEVFETGNFEYSIDALVETNYFFEKLQDLDLENQTLENQNFTFPSKYVESGNATVRTIALNKFISNSWLENLVQVTDWAHNYVTYDWNYYPQTYSTMQVLESKRGTCDEYATLAAGMFRAKKIPARFNVGISYSGKLWANHGWLEIFNPKNGWIPLDPTYGEAGIVDGTHIVLGNFMDPSDALNSTTYPSTAKVEFSESTQNPLTIEVLNVKKFENIVSISGKDFNTNAFETADLNVEIENKLDSYIIAPIQLTAHGDFFVEENKNLTLLLKPFEKRTISWHLKNTNSEIQFPTYIKYDFIVSSFSEMLSKNITVYPSNAKNEPNVSVKDVLPKVSGKNLSIEIVVENSGTENATIDINLTTEPVLERTEEVLKMSRKTIVLNIENFENKKYTLSVKTPATLYIQDIAPQQSEKIIEPENANAGQENSPFAEEIKNIQIKDPDLNKLLAFDNFLIAGTGVLAIAILLLLKNLLFKK